MKSSTQNLLLFFGVCICIAVAILFFKSKPEQADNAAAKSNNTNTAIATRDANMALGNPSQAGKLNLDNLLIERTQYTLSYNNSKGTPNWVCWHLSSAWKGNAPRSKNFFTNTDLPRGCYEVSPKDYSKSGFDRGHMCPSDDRDGSVADNEATFLMDNIVPQAPKNNQEVWNELEEHARRLTAQGNELYIIAGIYGRGGENKDGEYKTTIANGRITVPAHVWKIVVVLPNGDNDLKRITEKTKVIAVDMPNTQGVAQHNWQYYQTSVDEIEAKTGYDFLSNISPQLQNVLEGKQSDNGTARR